MTLAKLVDNMAEFVVQSLSRVRLFATPWAAACQASLSFTVSWSLLKLMSRVGDAIRPSHPLLSPSPPAFNLSQHQGAFHWVVLLIRWPKYWSFSLTVSTSKEYSGLISFSIDWLDLLAGLRDSQESSPAPQFESINSSALSLLYGRILLPWTF